MSKTVFDVIKKQNGERFAKAIRAYDNGIFDIPNFSEIVKYAGRNAEVIMAYLISLKGIKIEEHGAYQDPVKLLDQVGYDAFYVTSLEEQNSIEKYFEQKERLCTFHDEERYQNYHIINAVKKNVDEIKRENFLYPKREDDYGTSVISIQVLKTGGFISIKNRYNHTVNNPDNTFNSNPDNIILGLSDSIRHHFNVDFSSQKVMLPQDYVFINNQIIHYHVEAGNIYFGDKFYVKDGVIHMLKSHELMMDNFILDLKNKTIENPAYKKDGFMVALHTEIDGKTLQVQKDEAGQTCLLADGHSVLKIKDGHIVSVDFQQTTELENNFMYYNTQLKHFNAPKLTTIWHSCFLGNEELTELNLPQVTLIGSEFMPINKKLSCFNAPSLVKVGPDCFTDNEELTKLDLPNLSEIGNDFLYYNRKLSCFNAPKLTRVSKYCCYSNTELTQLDFPNLTEMGDYSFYHNEKLSCFNAPNLTKMEEGCFSCNRKLTNVNWPNLTVMGDRCLSLNTEMVHFNVPKLSKIYSSVLEQHPDREQLLMMTGKYQPALTNILKNSAVKQARILASKSRDI